MKDERKTEIRVGATVLLALLGFIFVITWAKNTTFGAARELVTVRFSSVSGLSVGDQVTVNGVKKGYVATIVNDPTSVCISLSLDPDVKLKSDAVFSVEMLDLMGGKKVEVTPGFAPTDLDYSKVAIGEFSADIPTIMKTAGPITKDFPKIMKSIDSTLTMLNKMLTDEMSQQNIRTSLMGLKDITIKVNTILDKNSTQINSLISNSNQLVSETRDVISKNKDDINATLKQAGELTQNANTVITKLDVLLSDTKSQKNNLGKILYDDSLMTQIKGLTGSLQKVVDVLNSQLTGKGVNVRAKIDLF